MVAIQTGKPEQVAKQVWRVSVNEPYTSFDSGVVGVPVVTRRGVRVTQEQLAQVKQTAQANGLVLNEWKEQ